MARIATSSDLCQLGTRRGRIDPPSAGTSMEQLNTFKPTGTSVGGLISAICCPVPWYTPVMANATYRTNMTYRQVNVVHQRSNDSNAIYPGSGREAVIPSKRFLYVQTTVHPQ